MPDRDEAVPWAEMECCPPLEHKPTCDTLDFRYLLPFRAAVGTNRATVIPVEVILHFRLERCSGDLALGDLAYTTTLLPGERVRLFTSDRHTRWSFDSETNLAYRHTTTSEESFYTASMARSMTDLTISEFGVASNVTKESWSEGGGGVGINLGVVKLGGGGSGGKYSASSLSTFARGLSMHAESSSSAAAYGVRASSATSIGEVEHREHAEGESESHFESASRTFVNHNRCQAVTYLFYTINKIQTVRFRLVAIERRVDDAGAPVRVEQRPPVDTTGGIAIRHQEIPATSKERLEVERMARTSLLERNQVMTNLGPSVLRGPLERVGFVPEPISDDLGAEALAQVDRELAETGLLDPDTGEPTERIVAELSWERTEVLPTPGLLVRGCLDTCDTCEPGQRKRIELELERMRLENELLQRRIELLDKAQEYRCCPGGDTEVEEETGPGRRPEGPPGGDDSS